MDAFHILACVTVQKSCEKMIVEGAKLARDMQGALTVLHVAPQGADMLGYPLEGDAMEYLYKISSEHGAVMTVMRSGDVVETIAQFVRKNGVNVVLMGAPSRKGGRNIMLELQLRLPDVMFQTVFAGD